MEKDRVKTNLYKAGALKGKRVKQTLMKKHLPANVLQIIASTPKPSEIKLLRREKTE